jgi:hypothetical protein
MMILRMSGQGTKGFPNRFVVSISWQTLLVPGPAAATVYPNGVIYTGNQAAWDPKPLRVERMKRSGHARIFSIAVYRAICYGTSPIPRKMSIYA